MKVIAFIMDYAVLDRIIKQLKLSFVAANPSTPHIDYQEVLRVAEASPGYFL